MRIGQSLVTLGDSSVADLIAEAAKAKARGYHSAWTNQRPGGMDPITLLAATADSPAELGTAVVPTYPRHPVVMATEALTAQAVTGGKFTLGIGPSHELMMTGQLGLPYEAPARHTREYLEILRPLLRGEHVKHAGRFYTVDTQLDIDAPEPSVLVSALGPRMLEVTRELADGTIALWVQPRLIADYLVPRLPDRRVVVSVPVSVTTEPDRVREGFARDLAIINELPAYRAVLDRGGLSGPGDTVVAGDEAAVAAELRRYADAGVTDLLLMPTGDERERERTLDLVPELFPA
ncbi:TIGR03564 family F420-dependent LLM class oxidoreductase [Amycolatopsis sp. 195334CR]|uniref:TIGR03564 family F420-dependent LLM class oxidoreductase n=1 Tax=Amycolatopsis sp. 195334CR TaxID=2814588 RepID=UPI001A8DDEC6|nr:TIGR03564 family F420-dependent LLM class oxidoreductase [Amycolatopsis sp. 195334CR]MBN6041276.1 TIGR03564 family F420-dependent LLM class oxidoreductase [Amycolatopsis sp. 195334CR]